MRAKETVMTPEQIGLVAYQQNEFFQGSMLEWTRKSNADQCIAEAQAEITWKAREPEIEEAFKAGQDSNVELIRDTYNKAYEKGEKAGMKKVIER